MATNLGIQKIAIFAGQGDLPVRLMKECIAQNIPHLVLTVEGQEPSFASTLEEKHAVRLGAIGHILDLLKTKKVSHVLFAGSLKRPSWSDLGLDWVGARWVARAGLKSLGDDGLLSAAADLLESEGFKLLSPADLLSDLPMPLGLLTDHAPNEHDWQDIRQGSEILNGMGAFDIGQAVVIQQGIVLAVEAIEGTDLMIERAGQHKRAGGGGVLIKRAKPNQNQQVDLPTIGLETLLNLHKAGLKGIAVGAHTSQFIDKETVIKKANELGVFVVGIE